MRKWWEGRGSKDTTVFRASTALRGVSASARCWGCLGPEPAGIQRCRDRSGCSLRSQRLWASVLTLQEKHWMISSVWGLPCTALALGDSEHAGFALQVPER